MYIECICLVADWVGYRESIQFHADVETEGWFNGFPHARVAKGTSVKSYLPFHLCSIDNKLTNAVSWIFNVVADVCTAFTMTFLTAYTKHD